MIEISHKTDEGWVYEDCKVERVIDGDTIIMRLAAEVEVSYDFGFRIKDKMVFRKEGVITFRVEGVDTPEIRGEEKEEGYRVKDEVETFLLMAESLRVVSLKEGKYGGRWIGKIYATQSTGEEIELTAWLIENEMGEPYRVR
jgi:endonuclease YncB( thermonuclease family)